jgi:hypothetical protein
MNQTHPLPTERLSDKLAELRASVAASAPRKGLEGTVQRACLRVFEILLRIITAWQEGTLAGAGFAPRMGRRLRIAPSGSSGVPILFYRKGRRRVAAWGTRRAPRARGTPPTPAARVKPGGKPLVPRKGGGRFAGWRDRRTRRAGRLPVLHVCGGARQPWHRRRVGVTERAA